MSDIENAYALITQYLDYLRRQYSPDELKAALAQRPRLLEMLRQLVDVEATPVPTPSTLAPFRTQGNQILYNGEPFQFAGCNIRELAYYSTAFMPYANAAAFVEQLDTARSIGFSVVRFYAFHVDGTIDLAIERTMKVLDALQARGMFGTVVLTDCAGSPFMVRERNPENWNNGFSHRWYGGGYNDDYLPAVKRLVAAVGNHPAIFAYEIGNELRTPFPPEPTLTQCQSMLEAFDVISTTIRLLTDQKLIATGLEHSYNLFVSNAYGGQQFSRKLYALPYIDVATVHSYQDEAGHIFGAAYERIPNEMAIDGIPMILEETGLIPSPAHLFPVFLERFVEMSITRFSGWQQWAFQATRGDVGSGGGGGMTRTCDNQNPCYQWQNLVTFWTALSQRLK